MSRKQQLEELLVARGVFTRDQAEQKTVATLEAALDKSLLEDIRRQARKQAQEVTSQEHQEVLAQYNAAQSEAILQHIFRTAINGRTLVDCESNRQALLNLLDETKGDRGITVQWFLNLLKENPSLRSQLAWQDVVDPAKRRHQEAAQAKQDRETFSVVARELGLADSDANFSIVSQLGPGLSNVRASITTMVGDNGPGIYLFDAEGNTFQLTPATPEQMQRWAYEKAKAHELWLRTEASPEELRREVRAEGAARAANQQTQATRDFEAAKARDSRMGYPPLPDTYLGQQLNAAFIKRASTEVLKTLIRRYGSAAVTEAVRVRT